MLLKKIQLMSITVIFAMLVGSAIFPYGSIAFAQQTPNTDSSNQTSNVLANVGTNANITTLLKPGNTTYNTALLDAKMLQLAASNKPKDIATLAYIWGYPLVTKSSVITQTTINPSSKSFV
jgi:hypothetical protein